MKSGIKTFKNKRYSLSFIWLLIIITSTFSYCIKPRKVIYKNCPGFNDYYFNLWFPYATNQSLYFKSSASSEIDTFLISSIEKSQPYQQNVFSGDSCSSSIKVQARNKKNGYDLYINYEKNLEYRSEIYSSIQLSVINRGWGFVGINEKGFKLENKQSTIKANYFDSMELNGIKFNNVQQIEADSSRVVVGSVYKLWFAKDKGLVGYQYFGTNEYWTLNN